MSAISETEQSRQCDDRTHYWPIGDDPSAGTPCKCGRTTLATRGEPVGNDSKHSEIIAMEQDAMRDRALRACFPVAEANRLMLTTQEADGGFCTYQAATLQEFDDAMQEIAERAVYRAAATQEET